MNMKKIIAMLLILTSFAVFAISCKDNGENNNENIGGEENQTPSPSKPEAITWEEYQEMTPEQRQNYYSKFENYEDFFAWASDAKSEFDKENGDFVLGEDGEIDLGDIFGDQ